MKESSCTLGPWVIQDSAEFVRRTGAGELFRSLRDSVFTVETSSGVGFRVKGLGLI